MTKYIYDFTVKVPTEIERESKTVENGVETTIKVKEKGTKDVKILIKKPSRKEREEADLEYSRYFFQMQDAGLYTKQQVAKRYNDAGGDLSKTEVEFYNELQLKLTTFTMEAQRYLIRGNSATEEEKKIGEEALTNITIVKRQIIDFETQRSEVFNHTADNKAFLRLLNWFTVFLGYKEEDGVISPLFAGDSFEKKMDDFESKIDSEDPLIFVVKDKLPAFIAYWFTSGAKTKEDFKPIEEEMGV